MSTAFFAENMKKGGVVVDKEKFRQTLLAMGTIGPFVEMEVLKGQEPLAYAQIPRGEGEDAEQVYVLTKDKLIWVYTHIEEGMMLYRTYFLRNLLEYEYGKIPAPAPDEVAKRAVLKLKFAGESEVGIASTAENPAAAPARHKIMVRGIDELERQLRKLTRCAPTTVPCDNICQEYTERNWAH
ncbi:MAG TPA: hypothetical protein DEA44_00970 [Firmicutes bacterium]|nr:hypothetical protein [Bacillota bacterium]